YLDEALISGEDDGLACRKKYSNNGNGLSEDAIKYFDHKAQAILENNKVPKRWLEVIDALTLASCIRDQHRLGRLPTEKEEEERKSAVVKYLEAGRKISPNYDYDN